MDTIQESLIQLQQMFVQRMDVYQGELQSATPSDSITKLTQDFTAFRAFIITALRSLQEQVSLITHQTDVMEMRSRRKILLFHGLSEVKNEDTAAIIVKEIVGHLKISEFSAKDISRCHRMGRLTAVNKPRPILLKLHKLELRNKIWSSKVTLKGSGITLSEFLTRPRHETFMAARQKFGITKCWTRDGFIFVLGAGGVRHRISSKAEFDKIPDPVPSKPIDTTAAKEIGTTSRARRAATSKK